MSTPIIQDSGKAGNRVILGTSAETGATETLDSYDKALSIANKVYNPLTDSWQPMTQPEATVNEHKYKDTRMSYDTSGNVEYIGQHEDIDAATSDVNWIITKLTWSNGNVIRSQVATAAWDDKGILFGG